MTSAGRLTRMDEYPRHQIGGTFDAVVSDSVHWNDGFYFTLGDEETGAPPRRPPLAGGPFAARAASSSSAASAVSSSGLAVFGKVALVTVTPPAE